MSQNINLDEVRKCPSNVRILGLHGYWNRSAIANIDFL